MEAVGVISYRNEDMVMIKLSRGCCEEEELQQVKEAFDYGYFGLDYAFIYIRSYCTGSQDVRCKTCIL